jgi:thiosulfate/3-mercaptopyruvate sulfurtransferase
MKKRVTIHLLFALLLIFPLSLFARDIAPIVSTDWLEKNLDNPKLRIIDIRKVEEYKEGHVPGAVNVFYNAWAIRKGDVQNELPANDDLADVIDSAGITKESLAVVVGKTDNIGELTNSTRVAFTLAYAGLTNVSILDGGYNKWVSEKKKVSRELTRPKVAGYKPAWNTNLALSKSGFQRAMNGAIIVDTRLPEFFFGVAKLDFVPKAGRIPGAVALPSAWMYMKEGTFKSREDLQAMVDGVIGTDKSKDVILYCDTGKICTGAWFVMAGVLGRNNIRVYDGSMEEWTRDPNAPLARYTWK